MRGFTSGSAEAPLASGSAEAPLAAEEEWVAPGLAAVSAMARVWRYPVKAEPKPEQRALPAELEGAGGAYGAACASSCCDCPRLARRRAAPCFARGRPA